MFNSIIEKFKKIINLNMTRNTGFLEKPEDISDYMIGASPIPFEVRVFNGNWTKFLPKGELQKEDGVETMSCVSFSALNSIEIQLNWMMHNNRMPKDAKEFLYKNNYIIDGNVNLSDRFLAIISNTQPTGNYLTTVAQALRDFGAIPELMLPFTGSTWKEYHNKSNIRKEMTDLGEEFSKYFTIQYEWIVTPSTSGLLEAQRKEMLRQLRHAPLQIAAQKHATNFYFGVNMIRWGQFDTYTPFEKVKRWSYSTPYVMKVLITPRSEYTEKQIKEAKVWVKAEILERHKQTYFARVNAHGEAYKVFANGSFKYKKGIPCPLFDSFMEDGLIVPISEDLWSKFKPAEIK